jgi:hypothetical protein
MAYVRKPDFVFRRNGRVHLNRQGRQFSRPLAAEMCASAVVMLDTPCSEVVWRVLAIHSIRQVPIRFPSRLSPCAITFQLDSTNTIRLDNAFAHVWCVSTRVWCAVGARFSSCEFGRTSDPCQTLHGCSRPGTSAGVAHATGKQRYTCSKNIHLFRSRSLVHFVALRTFSNGRSCTSVRNLRLNPLQEQTTD